MYRVSRSTIFFHFFSFSFSLSRGFFFEDDDDERRTTNDDDDIIDRFETDASHIVVPFLGRQSFFEKKKKKKKKKKEYDERTASKRCALANKHASLSSKLCGGEDAFDETR